MFSKIVIIIKLLVETPTAVQVNRSVNSYVYCVRAEIQVYDQNNSKMCSKSSNSAKAPALPRGYRSCIVEEKRGAWRPLSSKNISYKAGSV